MRQIDLFSESELNKQELANSDLGAVIRGFITCCKNMNIEYGFFTYEERNTEKQKIGKKSKCMSCGKIEVVY